MDYISDIWSGSRDFWTGLWHVIYVDIFAENAFLAHFLGTSAVILGGFVLFNSVFLLADITGWPGWLLQYKVQEDRNTPVDSAKLLKCVSNVSFNLLVVTPLFSLAWFPLADAVGAFHTGALPSFPRFCAEFAGFCAVLEVVFYYSHRAFHTPALYSRYSSAKLLSSLLLRKVIIQCTPPQSYYHMIHYLCTSGGTRNTTSGQPLSGSPPATVHPRR